MEKIAIIGLSCLFPDAQNPEEFWRNLIGQKDSKSLATAEDLGVDPAYFYDQDKSKADRTYSLMGGYIRDFQFNADEYALPSELIASLDPICKGSLYVAKQALESSSYFGNAEVLAKCGVILGNLSFPTKFSNQLFAPIYQQTIEPALRELVQQESLQLQALPTMAQASPYNAMTSSLPSAVVAQALSLASINFSLDAACSSSLYAVNLASHYLRSHQADLMLAGAVSYSDPLFIRMLFSGVQAYPSNGISSPLDKSSRGLTPADGVGMLVLKRYSDALRDGDRIYATVCGTGLSNDGRGKHLLSPNQQGQVLAFERAYNQAGITPQDIDYLECHATGTLLGDSTELSSIDAFFGKYQASPLVGSVKSNVGHLLTAAGVVGMIKIILSMSKGVIAPTINLNEPMSSPKQVISPEQIVRASTPWPNKDSPKRAAISAFGFGGTNAHLILEQPKPPQAMPDIWAEDSEPVATAKMAIVGMDALFGACDGLEAFDRSIYEGKQHFIPLPPKRWQGIEQQEQLLKDYGFEDSQAPLGAYIQDFEIDTLRFKIPPNEVEKLNPQQLLTIKVADRALQDAKLEEGGNVAVIIAMETDPAIHQLQERWHLPWQIEQGLTKESLSLPDEQLSQLQTILKDSIHHQAGTSEYVGYVGNIIASRISSVWNFNGPAFTLSAGENSVFKALEVAQMLISSGAVEAVVIGAVDLAGSPENILLRNQLAKINTGVHTLSFDEKANGWMPGEGAGVVVLKSIDAARQEQNRIYAVIDAISLVQSTQAQTKVSTLNNFPALPNSEAVKTACQQACQLAGIQPTDINYLEVFGSGIPQEDKSEIEGLIEAYRTSSSDLSCAIGSVKANIGHTYVASGMASLIKTALCLYHRYIPPVPQWSSPKMPEVWQGSPFYVDTAAKGWCLASEATKRIAAINGLGIDGTYAHLILSEELNQAERSNNYLQQMPFYLFPIAADESAALLEQLSTLEKTIADCDSLPIAASETFAVFQQQREATYKLAILGKDKVSLEREIKRAFQGVPKAFEQGKDWQTPGGSYFTAKPVGKDGKIAFVYPGAFNAYLGIARDLFRLFPKLFDDSVAQGTDSSLTRLERLFCPRSLHKFSRRELEVLEQELLDNGLGMLEAGVGLSGLLTTVMSDYFQVQADCTFGYSLGEISMICAQGVWASFHEVGTALNSSPLFCSRLSGSKDTVREYWGLSQDDDSQSADFWSTYVLMAPAEEVRECVQGEKHVYLTHVNTPTEVVIAGDKQACQRVKQTLKCEGFSLPLDHVLHCEAMASEYGEIVKINTLPIQNTPETVFYSAADYQPVKLESKSIGHNIGKALCQQLDFPRLINRVYEDGVRIFIEAGAGGTCSRWIDVNLKDKEHLSVTLDKRGADEHGCLLRGLARLLSHGVALDLSLLYCQLPAATTHQKSIVKTITLGGEWIQAKILRESNKEIFKNRVFQVLTQEDKAQQLLSNSSEFEVIEETRNKEQETGNDETGTPTSTDYRIEAEYSNLYSLSVPPKQTIIEQEKPSTFCPLPLTFSSKNATLGEDYVDELCSNSASSENQVKGEIGNNFESTINLQSYPEIKSKQEDNQQLTIPSETASSSVGVIDTPSLLNPYYQQLSENNSGLSQTYSFFLQAQKESLKQMQKIIQNQITFSQQLLEQESVITNQDDS
ncbi:MAG: beta-ketoacyl synthase [Symploca sp. SIO2B6]|nr:beta-ketoacyl synthase [Symploca sp. SIO2B6]